MPIIDLTLAKDTLAPEALERLIDKVGHIALEYEGLEGSRFAEQFTWTYVHELPAVHIGQIAGRPAKPIYRFVFTTLQALLDDQSKHRLGERVARAVYEAEGRPWDEPEAYNRVWVFFDDYRQGDWIVGARINSIKALRAKVEEQRVAQSA